MHRLPAAACFCILACLASPAQSVVLYFDAPLGLTGGQEVPPTPSTGTGTGELEYNSVARILHVSMTWTGLMSPSTASHLHVGSGPGTNGGVAVPFLGFPAGFSGDYERMFDLSDENTYSNSFFVLSGGTDEAAEAALVAALQAEHSYLNIHTTLWPGGEIRGDLAEVTPVPEPASVLLFGAGAAAALIKARRRRK